MDRWDEITMNVWSDWLVAQHAADAAIRRWADELYPLRTLWHWPDNPIFDTGPWTLMALHAMDRRRFPHLPRTTEVRDAPWVLPDFGWPTVGDEPLVTVKLWGDAGQRTEVMKYDPLATAFADPNQDQTSKLQAILGQIGRLFADLPLATAAGEPKSVAPQQFPRHWP